MTFNNLYGEYRVALDTTTQVFKVYDPENPTVAGFGVTIERALKELHNRKKEIA